MFILSEANVFSMTLRRKKCYNNCITGMKGVPPAALQRSANAEPLNYELVNFFRRQNMIPDSELDAQRIMETRCPNPALRTTYVSIIADGIIESNRHNRGL